MAHRRIFVCSAAVVVLSLLLAGGCGPGAGEAATFAFKFTPRDSTNYKLIMEAEDKVAFEGPIAKGPDFRGGCNRTKIEMTFSRQIQSVDDNGNAVAKITVRDLKYLSERDEKPVLDFDSAAEKDRDNPFAKLIGQSYTIEIAPDGQVKRVIDAKQARTVVKGPRQANKAASRLLAPDAIKKIHGTLVLPQAGEAQLRPGQSWSSAEVFDFRMLGMGSYEKIYTIKKMKKQDGQQTAVVHMNAIPSSGQAMHAFPNMFDKTQTYTGQLELDLSSGKVQKYSEKLQSQWLVVDPQAEQKDSKEPDALKMSVVRSYSLEKID